MFPYVISESHPDYKRPWLEQTFGVVKEEDIDTFFLNEICTFILDRIDINSLECENDVETFFDNYYDEYYMGNPPWDAQIFKNGEWENVTLLYETIWEHIQLIKSQDQETIEEQDDHFEVVTLDWEITDNELEIKAQMEEYIKSELDEEDLEIMDTMNETEKIIYILHKCMFNISSDKYKQNRELFHNFFNLFVKLIEKDISITTEELAKNHNEDDSLKLKYLTTIYSDWIKYKHIFTNS